MESAYLETHFEVVKAIVLAEENGSPSIVYRVLEEKGQGGLWELAKIWTDEFETLHKGTIWGEELDWLDTLTNFLNTKL